MATVMKRHVCVQQHLLLTSLEAKTRKAARMLISECATLENKEKNMSTVTHENSFTSTSSHKNLSCYT